MSLTVKALLGLFFLAVAVSVLLFAAAGTMDYWQGWLFLVVFIGAFRPGLNGSWTRKPTLWPFDKVVKP